MKWFKKNGLVFSLFLILGLFSYFEFQKTKTVTFKKAESEKLFLNFDKKTISSIDFYVQSKLDFQLKNQDTKWFVLKSNVKDKADISAVKIFLNKVAQIKKTSVTTKENLSTYQLNPVSHKIIFHSTDKKKYQLFLGAESFDKKKFILINEGKEVFLANSDLNFTLNKNFDIFRSKKLFFPEWKFDKIFVKAKKSNVILYNKNKSWFGLLKSYKNKPIKLNQEKVDKFISAFKHLTVQGFIRENPFKSNKLLKQYNLLTPELSLSVFNKNKKIWTINIAQDNEKQFVYAQTSERGTIYSVSKTVYKELSVSLNSLRDRSFAFQVDKKNTDKIFYQVGKRRRQNLYLSNGQWLFSKRKQIKTEIVNNLFSSISKLKVIRFIPINTFKRQPISLSLSFFDKKKELLNIKVVGYMSSQKNAKLQDLVVLDLQDKQEYFAISTVHWKSLLKGFFAKPKATKAEAKKLKTKNSKIKKTKVKKVKAKKTKI